MAISLANRMVRTGVYPTTGVITAAASDSRSQSAVLTKQDKPAVAKSTETRECVEQKPAVVSDKAMRCCG